MRPPARPQGRGRLAGAAAFAALLVLVFVASRACADRGQVDQEQAVAIARGRVDFEPDRVNVRFLRRGIGQRPFWAVSFSQRDDDGSGFRRVTVVVVDANTGEIDEVQRER